MCELSCWLDTVGSIHDGCARAYCSAQDIIYGRSLVQSDYDERAM
jgi:hypothetical protein